MAHGERDDQTEMKSYCTISKKQVMVIVSHVFYIFQLKLDGKVSGQNIYPKGSRASS